MAALRSNTTSSSCSSKSLIHSATYPKETASSDPIVFLHRPFTTVLSPLKKIADMKMEEKKLESSILTVKELDGSLDVIHFLQTHREGSPEIEEKLIVSLKHDKIKKEILAVPISFYLIMYDLTRETAVYNFNKILQFLLIEDMDYRRLFFPEHYDPSQLRHPILTEILPTLICTREAFIKIAIHPQCAEYGSSDSMRIRLFLTDHPTLSHLVLNKTPAEMSRLRAFTIAEAIICIPITIARIIADYGYGDYSPSKPQFFSVSWTFLNFIQSYTRWELRDIQANDDIQVRWPKPLETFVVMLSFGKFGRMYNSVKCRDYLTGLNSLKRRKIISMGDWENPTTSKTSKKWDIEVIKIFGSSPFSPEGPVHVCFHTKRGMIAGMELAIQMGILSIEDQEFISRYITETCGQSGFQQACVMIAFSRAIQEPTLQPAIDNLMPAILDFIGDDPSQQIPFDCASFSKTKLFKIHAEDEIQSAKEFSNKTRALRSYLSPHHIFSNHQSLARTIVKTLDEIPIKSTKFMNFFVSSTIEKEKMKGKKFKEDGDFNKAVTAFLK